MEGGGGGDEVQKKTLVPGKIQWQKNYARPVNLKNVHALV